MVGQDIMCTTYKARCTYHCGIHRRCICGGLGGMDALEGGDSTLISPAEMCHFVGVMAMVISRPVVVI